MDDYQEEIEFTRHLFYKGTAYLKYGGNLNRYQSQKSGINHFEHTRYYDIRITDIRQLSEKQYKNWKKAFQLRTLKGDVIGVHKDENYTLDTDLLYIDKALNLSHNQIEGDEVHGYFESVPVVFKMYRSEKKTVCIKGIATGNEELREDGLYKEITTGEFNLDELTCSTQWFKDGKEPPTCEEGKPTGKKENKNKCYRLEYYKADCSTYWGEWICECVQDEWTGNEKEEGGWIWREYFNSDCTTIWKQYKIFEPPVGCLSYLPFILAILWAALCCYWAVKYGSFMPILFGIGIPLFLAGFGYAINFLGRFSRGIGRLFKWIMNLLAFLFILFLLNGLISFFTSSHWGGGRVPVDTSWDKQEVLPEDQGNESNVIDTDDGKKLNRDKITVKLKWKDLEDNRYVGKYSIYKDELALSVTNIKNLKTLNLSSFRSVYLKIYEEDKKYFGSIYSMLDSIRLNKRQNKLQFANTIVSMVQSIDYVLILEEDCNDPEVLRNNQIRQMKLTGVPCEGYAPFGIKTPTQFLSNLKGDCDSRTLILYTILKHFNYDVAIINSDYYVHSMLGVNIQGVNGVFKAYYGRKYYFWETTSKGFGIGQLPKETGELNYWKIELN